MLKSYKEKKINVENLRRYLIVTCRFKAGAVGLECVHCTHRVGR